MSNVKTNAHLVSAADLLSDGAAQLEQAGYHALAEHAHGLVEEIETELQFFKDGIESGPLHRMAGIQIIGGGHAK